MSETDSTAYPEERIFCPECGEQIPDTCRFCIWCGCNLAFIRPYLDKKREGKNMLHPLAEPDLSRNAPRGYPGTPEKMIRNPVHDLPVDSILADRRTQDQMFHPPIPDMPQEQHPARATSSFDLPCSDLDINLTDFHGYADALKNEGDACYQEGEYHEAIYFYDVALGINPDFEPAWNNKGLTLVKLGRIQEAEGCLDEVRRLRQRPAITDMGITDDLAQDSPPIGQEPEILV
jgi:tetratricopeptide (TPR) repeat protein